jgi:2-oxoacid:acceptor oxidoreductase gamma subunit (pyruvate/2-ketoisovalerate family)
MIEIRFHGRGGQGAVLASELLAQAAFLEGKYPQSFPFFGVERRGAPVTAFARIDDRPVAVRTSVTAPDIVVVLDAALPRAVPVADGLRPAGLVLINSARPPLAFRLPPGARVVTVDATSIALAHRLGSRTAPIVNTAMLGALSRASGAVSLPALTRAIREGVPAKQEENVRAAAEAFEAAGATPSALAEVVL